jgi:hypothetical protein
MSNVLQRPTRGGVPVKFGWELKLWIGQRATGAWR